MTSRRLSTNWIVGKKVDLAAFIGGALAGYAVFFMHAGLGWDMVLIYVLFLTFLDTPHFFGTYLRTYLDRGRIQGAAGLSAREPPLAFWPGPSSCSWPTCLFRAGVANYMVPFNVFILAVGIWAYWHVVRQHYGFMRLYQAKNGENALTDRRRDGWLMHLGLMLPFVVFAIRHPEARQAFGLPKQVPPLPSFSALGGWHGILAGSWIGRMSWEHFVAAGCALALAGLIGDFIVRQAAKWRRGRALERPQDPPFRGRPAAAYRGLLFARGPDRPPHHLQRLRHHLPRHPVPCPGVLPPAPPLPRPQRRPLRPGSPPSSPATS